MQPPIWELLSFEALPAGLAPFLSERGSFTRKMESVTHHQCDVAIQDQGWQLPNSDEQACLGLAEGEHVWVREVVLNFGEPCVFARSIFPKSLVDSDQRFQGLGANTLATILFQDPAIYRDDIEVAVLHPEHGLFKKAVAHLPNIPEQLWARRSKFHLHDFQLLVCEVMFPHVATL